MRVMVSLFKKKKSNFSLFNHFIFIFFLNSEMLWQICTFMFIVSKPVDLSKFQSLQELSIFHSLIQKLVCAYNINLHNLIVCTMRSRLLFLSIHTYFWADFLSLFIMWLVFSSLYFSMCYTTVCCIPLL